VHELVTVNTDCINARFNYEMYHLELLWTCPSVVILKTKQGFGHWIICRPQEQTLRVVWPNLQLMIVTDSFTEIFVMITRLWTKHRNLVLNIFGRFP